MRVRQPSSLSRTTPEKPRNPPRNPGNPQDFGWTPWSAPLFVASFAWLPCLLIAHYVSTWTLAVTVPALVTALLAFWRHQRNLPGVTSWWRR